MKSISSTSTTNSTNQTNQTNKQTNNSNNNNSFDSTCDSSSSNHNHSHSVSFQHHTILIPQSNHNNNNLNNNQNNNDNQNNHITFIIIILSSILTSSISSIYISTLSTQLTHLPLSTFSTLEFLSLAISTRIPNLILPIQSYLLNYHSKSNYHNSILSSNSSSNRRTATTASTSSSTSSSFAPSSSSSNPSSPASSSNHHHHHHHLNNHNIQHHHYRLLNPFNHLPRFTKWRLLIKFTLPIALLNLITSLSRSHIAAQISCSTWQAFEVYSLPVAFVVLNRLSSLNRPNPELLPILSIITFTISLLIFNQSIYPHVILLALISATSQALYLIHLKTWLLSFSHLTPSHPLACSSSFSLLFLLLPTIFNLLFRSVHPFQNPLALIPPIDSLSALSILFYALFRLSDRLIELWALHRFQSPLSVLLLIPSRNLLSIILGQFFRFYIGRLGSYLSFLVYGFSIWAIYLAQSDTSSTSHPIYKYFLLNPSNGPTSILYHFFQRPKHPFHHDHSHQPKTYQPQHHHDQRRRSSIGGSVAHQDDYHLETIQEKSSYDDLMINHHSSRQKYRHHRFTLAGGYSTSDHHHVQDQPGKPTPVRFRKLSSDRQYRQTRIDRHWQTFFQVLAFGTLPIMMILKLVLKSQVGLPVTEVAIGTVRPVGSVDLVFSYYNEPLGKFSEAVEYVRTHSELSKQNPRVIVYVKHPTTPLATIRMTVNADEVIRLKNVGREGGTYLTHILRHYNSSLRIINPVSTAHHPTIAFSPTTTNIRRGTMYNKEEIVDPHVLEHDNLLGIERISNNSPIIYGLADHTVFMQPEISWHWIAQPRMNLFNPKSTGFLSFGPYLSSVCGEDGLGNGNYERMRDIYTIFHDSFCPPTGQLASYAGQFVVSRRRILMNPYIKYKKMRELLEAPIDHWIHREGGWLKWKGATDEGEAKNTVGPNAPFLGHALERSWPVVFHCVDPAIASSCPDDVVDAQLCQCHDPGP